MPDVRRYLSVCDNRFEVFISDNVSTDGTYEALSSIADSRLSVHVNESNIGPVRNGMSALSNAHGDYLFFLIDKDTINENLLSHFIDYLVTEKPCFGFVDLSIQKHDYYEVFQPGLDSILKTGFLGKHPSGYFWRRDLFIKQLSRQEVEASVNETDFPYDVISGFLAAEYPASIVHIPLVINANLRSALPEYARSFTYHGEGKFFGSAENRLKTYRCFLSAAMQLKVSRKEKMVLDKKLTNGVIDQVTVSLRKMLNSTSVCDHYLLIRRKVSMVEMFSNLRKVYRVRKDVIRTFHDVPFFRPDIIITFIKGVVLIFEQVFLEPFFSSELELGV